MRAGSRFLWVGDGGLALSPFALALSPLFVGGVGVFFAAALDAVEVGAASASALAPVRLFQVPGRRYAFRLAQFYYRRYVSLGDGHAFLAGGDPETVLDEPGPT